MWRATARVWAQTRSHRDRVEAAKTVFRRAAEVGPIAISSSWGKDSVCCCDLAVDVLGEDVRIFHLAGPYELPGYEAIREHFALRAIVDEVPSSRTLAEVIEWLHDVGLGCDRTDKAKTARRKANVGEQWCRDQGIAIEVMGLRAEESRQRRLSALFRGQVYRRVSGIWVALPIAWWKSTDVWAYLVSRNLPWHPLYDCETHGFNRYELRNTGWLTTIDVSEGRVPWLRQHFPEQYRLLVEEWPHLRQAQ